MLASHLGCQKWTIRPGVQQLFDEDTDDWAPPVRSAPEMDAPEAADGSKPKQAWWGKRNSGSVPRVILPRDRKVAQTPMVPPAELASSPIAAAPENPAAQIAEAAPSPQESKVVAFGANPSSEPGKVVAPATEPAAPKPESAAPKVVDTGVNEVDIEGALQTLPNEYRDVIKQTLVALQQKKIAEEKGAPLPETSLAATETPPVTSAPAPPELPSPPVATAPPTQPVSIRIAESQMTRSDAPSIEPPAMAAPATSEVALASKEVNAPSQVVAAGAFEPKTAGLNPTASWHQMTSHAIEALEAQLESAPPSDESLRISQEVTLRMLYVAQRRLDDALRPIDRLTEHEQEFLRHQMQAMYEASNPDANPVRSRHWSLVMNSQREATAHLAAVSNLEVRSVEFCTQVDGYGVYQPFARNRFVPDQDVLLYCEIDNVAAEKVKSGFETQLQGSYEIRDAQGRRVADQILPMEPEICQNHRRDYFIVYRIYMPQQVPPGAYQLKLTIEDMKGRKFGQSTADFEIQK